MIKNKRDLALSLRNNGKVEISSVSIRLSRIVDLWISYKSIKKEGSFLVGQF